VRGLRRRFPPSSRSRRGIPPPCGPLLAAAIAVGVLTGCASSGPPPPWRSGHPDPASLSLLDPAQAGSCAAAAPYPGQAPAAISFQGQEYVQSSRQPYQASPAGSVEIDHSGDWSFFFGSGATLTLVTPQADFVYQARGC